MGHFDYNGSGYLCKHATTKYPWNEAIIKYEICCQIIHKLHECRASELTIHKYSFSTTTLTVTMEEEIMLRITNHIIQQL